MNSISIAISIGIIICLIISLYKSFSNKSLFKAQSKLDDRFKEILGEFISQADILNNESLNKIKNALDLSLHLDKARQELAHLRAEKSLIEEKFAREKREIEHKLGLERMRQQQELELSKRETTVSLREEALKTERDMFKKEVEAIQNRFENQLKDQNLLIKNLLGALPNMTIIKSEHTER